MNIAQKKKNAGVPSSLEERLLNFQKEQEQALGLDLENKNQWFDPVPHQFLAKDKSTTTLLFGG
ncbi:hypothetical protein [Paenibacillus donghaensis]|uniref:hypothetical protein n=1 Tax=Paenibacillus donghaensis TaxID=414771 RepID=UPI001FEC7578|nr:hypothetical protein [Paenibacillus donghaensis]